MEETEIRDVNDANKIEDMLLYRFVTPKIGLNLFVSDPLATCCCAVADDNISNEKHYSKYKSFSVKRKGYCGY